MGALTNGFSCVMISHSNKAERRPFSPCPPFARQVFIWILSGFLKSGNFANFRAALNNAVRIFIFYLEVLTH